MARRVVSEKTHEMLTDALVRPRRQNEHLAGETTLLCYGAMDLCGGNQVQRRSGRRAVESVLRRNGIPERRRNSMVKRITGSKKEDVASFLISLRPFTETRKWLQLETA